MQKHRSASSERIIARMIGRIVQKFDPERIILFGSHATGTAGAGSDIDLLVVMPTPKSRRDSAVAVRTVLHDIAVPKDIVVTTPEEYSWRKDAAGTIECVAERQGRSLYVRS